MSSYVSFLTGLVVQAAGGWWWVVPVVLGSTGVALITARVSRNSAHPVALLA